MRHPNAGDTGPFLFLVLNDRSELQSFDGKSRRIHWIHIFDAGFKSPSEAPSADNCAHFHKCLINRAA